MKETLHHKKLPELDQIHLAESLTLVDEQLNFKMLIVNK